MDRCFDLRGALRQEVLAALSQLPTEEGPQNLASHWKMFHTRTSLGIFQHVGCCTPAWPTRPSEFESCLLPGGSVASADQMPDSEAAPGTKA